MSPELWGITTPHNPIDTELVSPVLCIDDKRGVIPPIIQGIQSP